MTPQEFEDQLKQCSRVWRS